MKKNITKTFKTFKQIKALYKIEKWFHTPWHFSQSGQLRELVKSVTNAPAAMNTWCAAGGNAA